MSDICDKAQPIIEYELERHLARIPTKYEPPPGAPGECDLCGRDSGRLINGVCAPCRDGCSPFALRVSN